MRSILKNNFTSSYYILINYLEKERNMSYSQLNSVFGGTAAPNQNPFGGQAQQTSSQPQGQQAAPSIFGTQAPQGATNTQSTFGTQQPAGNSSSFFGGAQTQSSTPAFGATTQPSTGGFFNQTAASQQQPQGGTALVSNNPLFSGASGSQQAAPPAQSAFGGFTQAQKPQSSGLSFFGQQVGAQQQPNAMGSSPFQQPSGPTQQQPAQSSLFNATGTATSTFNQPAKSAFSTGATGNQGGFFQNAGQPQQQNTSSFFNTTQNQASGFAQPVMASNSIFNASASQAPSGFNQGQQQANPLQAAQGQKPVYSEQHLFPAKLSSVGYNFKGNQQVVPVSKPNECPNMNFYSIRAEAQFANVSGQMLRFLDVMQMKGQQAVNFEFTAMQQFQTNAGQYALQAKMANLRQGGDLNKTGSLGISPLSASSQFNPPGAQSSSLFNNAAKAPSSAFPGSSIFNSGTQQPQTNSLFNSQQPQQVQQSGGWPSAQPQASTSLFNQNPQQQQAPAQGNSLFNQQQPQTQQPPALQQNQNSLFAPKPTTSSLFPQGQPGQQQPQAQQTSSLFQQPGQSQGTSLFSQNPSQQPGQTSSLFNQQQPQANTAQSSSLFNTGTQQQQPSSTSLFSQGQQPGAQQQSSLFQQKPATGQPSGNISQMFNQMVSNPGQSTMFNQGQTPAAQGQQSSLFAPKPAGQQSLFAPAQGMSAPQSNQQPTSLFQQPQQNSSLFNAQQPVASQTPLFPGQQQTQQPNQQAQFNPLDIYGNKDPFGLAQGLQSKPELLAENIQKELDILKKKAEESQMKKSSGYELHQQEPDSVIAGVYTDPLLASMSVQLCQASSNAYHEEEERQQAKLNVKYGVKSSYADIASKASKFTSDGYKDLTSMSNLYRPSFEGIYLNNRIDWSLAAEKPQNKPDLSKKDQKSSSAEPERPASKSSSKQPEGTINVTIVFQYTEGDDKFPDQTLKVLIHKSRDVLDLVERAKTWLTKEFNYSENGQSFNLMFKNKALDPKTSLKESKIDGDCRIYVVLADESAKDEQAPGSQLEKSIEVAPKAAAKRDEVQQVPLDRVPKGPKADYQIKPSLPELSRMSMQELSSVNNFTVSNQFGSIQFMGETDLVDVDLKDVVTITQGFAEVYDDQRHLDKPSVGQKLNRPAMITLNNIKPKANQTASKKEEVLRQKVEKDGGAQHLSYDGDKFIWCFKVEHFTKWGADDDDDEEEMQSEEEVDYVDKMMEVQSDNNQVEVNVVKRKENDIYPYIGYEVDSQMDGVEGESEPIAKRRLTTEASKDSMMVEINEEPAGSTQMTGRQLDRISIMNKIKQRESEIAKHAPTLAKRPSNTETIAYLKQMGVTKLTKSSLRQSAGQRPCFHPSGSIAFVHGSKVSLVPTQASQKSQEINLSDILLKYVERDINDQIGHMSLQGGFSRNSTGAVASRFDDSFFKKMFDLPLPRFDIFLGSSDIDGNVSMNKFLRDLATKLVEHDSPQSRHEFYVICMLNALFGNPNINLCSLHPDHSEAQHFARQWHIFGHVSVDEADKATQKKRRNAVTQVLRFICAKENPVAQAASVNIRVYNMLLNGEIVRAVKTLTAAKKTKLALIVSQAASGTFQQDYLKKQVDRMFKGAAVDASLMKILNLITGEAPVNSTWEQSLLSTLLFGSQPTTLFNEIIQSKNYNTESLLWSLMQLSAGVPHAADNFVHFNNKLTPYSDTRDFRMRWLTQLILKHALFTRSRQIEDVNQPIIDELSFTDISEHFVKQLTHQSNPGSFQSAVMVCMLMPSSQESIRKRSLFDLLCNQVHLFAKSRFMQNFLTEKLHVTRDWLDVSLALFYQSNGLQEKAMQHWMSCNNFRMANQLFYKNILPLYMSKRCSLGSLKALQQQDRNLMPSEKKSWFEESLIVKPDSELAKVMEELKQHEAEIGDWNLTTRNFNMYLDLVDQLRNHNNFTMNDVECLKVFVDKIERIKKALVDKEDPVATFIKQELAWVDSQLKVNLMLVGDSHDLSRVANDGTFEGNYPSARRNLEQEAMAAILCDQK